MKHMLGRLTAKRLLSKRNWVKPITKFLYRVVETNSLPEVYEVN